MIPSAAVFSCLLLGLAACAAPANQRAQVVGLPTEPLHLARLAAGPGAARPQEAAPSAEPTVLCVGLGVTSSPNTTLYSGSFDIPVDTNLTLGPALQLGEDGDESLFAAQLQGKYFLQDGSGPVRPYLSCAFGLGEVDPVGRGEDWGLLVGLGAGLRFRTGERFLIGSQVDLQWAPDRLAGERSYVSWQIVQFLLPF